MTRSTPSSVTTPFRAETSGQVWCLDLATGGSPANRRLTSYDGAVTLGGVEYTPHPMEVGEASLDHGAEIDTVTVRLGDDGTWQTWLDAAGGDFHGQAVVLYRTSTSALEAGAGADDAYRDDYYVESWRRTQGVVELQLRSLLHALQTEVPKRTITRRLFPGIPDVNRV